jgi:tetratricopeptide (TPR) repeat protein
MGLLAEALSKLSRWKNRLTVHNQIRLFVHKADSLVQRRDYSGARDHFLKALQIQQPTANSAIPEYILSRLARTWFEEERFVEEVAFLTEYIKTHPESQNGYRERLHSGIKVILARQLMTTHGQLSWTPRICAHFAGVGKYSLNSEKPMQH